MICPLTAVHAARYGTFFAQHRPKVLFTASYSNSANVLHTVLHELPKLVNWLGGDRVHVSLNEGGSRDGSVALLHHIARAIRHAGGSYTIAVEGNATDPAAWKPSRIEILAKARNDAMADLHTDVSRAFGDFDTVVFTNDVRRCYARAR